MTARAARLVRVIAPGWLCWLVSIAPFAARAQERIAPSLEWHAPAECPTRSEVLARLTAELSAEERNQDWRASAQIFRERAGYRLELRLQLGNAPAAERELHAATCRALVDAVAVLISLALESKPPEPIGVGAPAADGGEAPDDGATIDRSRLGTPAPGVAGKPGPRRTEPAAAQPSAVAEDEGERAEADSGSDESVPLALVAGAALRLDVGTLPQAVGFGVQPRLGLRWGSFEALAGLTIWLPGETTPAAYPRARVGGDALFADAVLAYAVGVSPLRITAGIALELGALSIEVTRIATPSPQTLRWTAAGASLSAEYELGTFGGFVEATGLVPFSRPRPVVRTASGDVPVYTPAAFSLRISAGVTYRFELR